MVLAHFRFPYSHRELRDAGRREADRGRARGAGDAGAMSSMLIAMAVHAQQDNRRNGARSFCLASV